MPFQTPFEPGTGLFDGEITSFHHEFNPPATNPATIISTDQEWHIHIDWQTSGILNPIFTGNWHLHCYLESVGPGPDVDITDIADPDAPHVVPLDPRIGTSFYTSVFTVKKNVVGLPPGTPMLQTGLYKLVVALTYITTLNTPGPVAAFQEGPILQFYNPT